MLRTGFHQRFASLPVDGVYLDKAFAAQPQGALNKIYGAILEWGSRRRGVLPTGDNRNQDFAKLGANDCWIRLGEPTVEAIRRAVLADSARIAYERPALPAQRILELLVNSTLTGPGFALILNDGFTSLIGGRGSGKSAILEYLRFGLGRSAGDVVSGEETYRERDRELIAKTLADGSVSVRLERDGVVETWTRTGAERDQITVKVEDGQDLSLPISEAQLRFRARGFYQGQLSSILSDRDRTAEQITGIAAAEFTDRRRLAEREIEAAKREVAAAYQRVVEFWVAEGEHRSSVAAVADLRARVAAISGRMTEAGLNEEQQRVLNDAPDYRLAESLIEEARREIAEDRATLEEIGSRLVSLRGDEWEQLVGRFPELQDVMAARTRAEVQVRGALKGVGQALDQLESDREIVFGRIEAAISDFGARHTEAKTLQESGRALFEEAQRLQSELQVALAGERASAARMERLAAAPDGLALSRATLRVKVDGLRALLGEAAASVDAMSSDLLRASVQRDRTPKDQVEALSGLCEGARIRELQSKCEEKVRELTAQIDGPGWDGLVDAVLETRKFRLQSGVTNIEIGDRIGQVIRDNLLGELTSGQLNAVFSRADDGAVTRILTSTPEDHIEFEYRDAGAYMPFAQASPGQQAAALLQLLLNQEAGTLIIDQPEDDLDNRVIMDIAKLLQSTKRRRQLVFATHNPNFVVNGDADKVVALLPGSADARPGSGLASRVGIDSDGAIETPTVRAAITDTMEGGRAAFELRGRKYDFDPS
jgi:ABC-type cobalamin/Fe3+-siderophores transport system ATPase subunit